MKLRIAVTVELTPEQVKTLTKIAQTCGHGFDNCKAPGKLIRRYLTESLMNKIHYCHEHLDRDEPEDENS